MTFNATSLSLDQAEAKDALRQYLPRRPRGEQQRWLLVTPEIDDLLKGKSQRGQFPAVEAEILIGIFCAGHLIRVSRRVTNERPDVEQIVGVEQVWAICPRKPKPGWRILGRFYKKDYFIGLRAWDKNQLAGKYGLACSEVVEDWKNLFGDRAPHNGPNISDYLGGVIKDVDEAL